MKPKDAERAVQLTLAFFTEIGIIAQLSSTAIERALPPGLSLAQFGVLNHFARLGGEQTPARLAAAFQVTRGAMTNTLQRLERQGLVSIKRDPEDGRRKLVRLTARGRRMRDRAIAGFTPTLLEVAEHLPLDELAAALPLLQRIRTDLDEARNDRDFDPARGPTRG